jgi:hypothetical protein
MDQSGPAPSNPQGINNLLVISRGLLLTSSLHHPALAQQQFSSERVPTISRVFLTIKFLLTSLEAVEKDATFTPICSAITAGISNLTKWYRQLDTCHVYAVSNGTLNWVVYNTNN